MVSFKLMLLHVAGSLILGLVAGAYFGIRIAVCEVVRRAKAKGYTRSDIMWFLQSLRGL